MQIFSARPPIRQGSVKAIMVGAARDLTPWPPLPSHTPQPGEGEPPTLVFTKLEWAPSPWAEGWGEGDRIKSGGDAPSPGGGVGDGRGGRGVRSGGGRLLAGLLLLACLLSSNAEAGQNRWTPFGIGGGTVFSLAVDPTVPGVVYAAALSGGIYRSADAGRTWQWRGVATTSLVVLWTDVIVSPTDPQRLYATAREGVLATTGRLYTSSDGGAHWQELFHLPDAGL